MMIFFQFLSKSYSRTDDTFFLKILLINQLPRKKPCWYLLRKYPSANSGGEVNPIMINKWLK